MQYKKMKVILSSAFIIFTYVQSFANSILQISNNISIGEDGPPPPGNIDGNTSTFGVEPGEPDLSTPINFIVPFLLISVLILTVYFIHRKNKLKNI